VPCTAAVYLLRTPRTARPMRTAFALSDAELDERGELLGRVGPQTRVLPAPLDVRGHACRPG